MFLFLFLQSIKSKEIKINEFTYETIESTQNEAKLIGFDDSLGKNYSKLIIPSSIQDESGTFYNVTSIGEGVFYKTTSFIGEIEFPSSLREIGFNCFNYSNLHGNLILPDSLETLGSFCFSFTPIVSLVFGENSKIIEIPSSCFQNCEFLIYVQFPKSLQIIGNSSFYCCVSFSNIEPLSICENLRIISHLAFMYCKSLSGDLNLPDSVTFLGMDCFALTLIESVTFGSKIVEISAQAFTNATIKCEIYLPDSLEKIGSAAFSSTLIYGELRIPPKITIIETYTFQNTEINSLILNENLLAIDSMAFYMCYSLSGTITCPQSLVLIGDSTFTYTNITTIYFNTKLQLFGPSCFKYSSIRSIELPPRIKEIPKDFAFMSSLSGTLTIPDSVQMIGQTAFMFTFIRKLVFEGPISVISQYAFAFNCYLTGSLPAISAQQIGAFAFAYCSFTVIPSFNCDYIGNNAFYMNMELTGHTQLTCISIGEQAFMYCTKLQSLQIFTDNPEFVVPQYICMGNKELERCVLNSSIRIEQLAFAFCDKLQMVSITPSLQWIGSSAFYGCTSLYIPLALTAYKNLTNIRDQAFYGCKSLTGEISFPNSLKEIGDLAFFASGISGSIYIPDSVETIGKQAFFCCHKLTGSLYIGKNCSTLGESAFSMCTSLSGSLNIEGSMNVINPYTFYGCASLKGSLNISDNIETICEYAFMGCSGFTGILSLSNSLKTIGKYAFASCTGLSGSLTIPESVETIEQSAFFGCIGFDEIHFQNSSTVVESFAFSRLHNKCFSNVPASFKSNEPQVYQSDNFDGKIIPASFLNLHCSAFYVIDNIVYALTVIFSSGILFTCIAIAMKIFTAVRRNMSRMESVFKDIIQKELNNREIADNDERARNIVNGIQDYLLYEMNDEKFTITKWEANRSLKKSIRKTWKTIHVQHESYINDHAFNDISFHKFCSKCRCNKQKDSQQSAEQSPLTGPLI